MTAETINLRLARKRKRREEAAAKAADKRARFGVPKAERRKQDAEQARAERTHAGHKLDDR